MLEDDYYIYDEQLYRLIGRSTGMVYALGQRVTVKGNGGGSGDAPRGICLGRGGDGSGTKLHKQAHRTRNQKKRRENGVGGGKNGAAGSSVGIGNLIYYTIQQKKRGRARMPASTEKRSPYRTDGPVTNILWRTG